jgi:uncharacterized protein
MHFSQDSFASNTIRAYSDGEISVNEKNINRSVIITADVIQLWEPAHIDDLTAQHCETIAGFNPEVVIIGTGKRLQFPAAPVIAGLQIQGIGVEIMAHGAACRTFNILLGEDRKVVAALLMNGPDM